MAWDDVDFRQELAEAADEYDRARASQLIDDLLTHLAASDDTYPEAEARRVLDILRQKRFFDELSRTGDAFIRSGQNAPVVRRLYAQALIEQGNLSLAETVLASVVADTVAGEKENREARGLQGRAGKQAYVDAAPAITQRTRDSLRRAVESYHGVYREDPTQLWHGINTVALLMRGAKDGVDLPGFPDPSDLASAILAAIEERSIDQAADMWDYGTALEACVALGRDEEAVTWAKRYVVDPNANAFEFASTLRQLEEVWQLTPEGEPGTWLIPFLRSAILGQQGGAIDLEAGTAHLESLKRGVEEGTLEAVLGTEHFEGITWLLDALERSGSVARITDQGGRPKGTGFVVRAGDVGALTPDPEELLLITNAHVIAPDPTTAAVASDEAKITFERDEAQTSYAVKDIVDSSPEDDLDATIIRTEPPLAQAPVPVAPRVPNNGARVYVIGHPQGRALSWSIYDNELLNQDEPYLRYRTPTEGGSSGSPVFNRDWRLIGLHHKGDLRIPLEGKEGLHPANEGIAINAIKGRLTGT